MTYALSPISHFRQARQYAASSCCAVESPLPACMGTIPGPFIPSASRMSPTVLRHRLTPLRPRIEDNSASIKISTPSLRHLSASDNAPPVPRWRVNLGQLVNPRLPGPIQIRTAAPNASAQQARSA